MTFQEGVYLVSAFARGSSVEKGGPYALSQYNYSHDTAGVLIDVEEVSGYVIDVVEGP